MMKIVVIGGSGFIGTRLVTRLIELGHQVTIFDLAPSQAHPGLVTPGDIRDVAAVTRALVGADCVMNLAAEHRDDVQPASRYFEVNVDGAENVVAAAEKNQVRFLVFISSVSVYGLDQPDADESCPIAPVNAYGRSKAEAEQVYEHWASSEPSHALLTLRPVVVFGEGNRGNVYNLIEQIRRRRLLMIGDGKNRKSIAYVGNLVDFICTQLAAVPGLRLFNYADKPDKSIGELVATICSLLPRIKVPRFALPYWCALAIGYVCDLVAKIMRKPLMISSVRVRKFCADTRIRTAALEQTAFTPRYTIDDGLQKMIAAMMTEPAIIPPVVDTTTKT